MRKGKDEWVYNKMVGSWSVTNGLGISHMFLEACYLINNNTPTRIGDRYTLLLSGDKSVNLMLFFLTILPILYASQWTKARSYLALLQVCSNPPFLPVLEFDSGSSRITNSSNVRTSIQIAFWALLTILAIRVVFEILKWTVGCCAFFMKILSLVASYFTIYTLKIHRSIELSTCVDQSRLS